MEKQCNVCEYTLPVEEFVTEWVYGFELPEEMCDDCAQEYYNEVTSKHMGL